MPNELDLLMDKDPLDLSAQDIDAIIKYQREARRRYEAGEKPTKAASAKISLDLKTLLPDLPKPEGPKMRRI